MEHPQIYDIKLYHEKQSKLLCALHAVNNLLQKEQFLTKDFDKIAKELSPSSFFFNNPHKSFFGNYDANVMLVALGKAGMVAQWLDYKGAQRAGAKLLECHRQACHVTPPSAAVNAHPDPSVAQLTAISTVSPQPPAQATAEVTTSTTFMSAEAGATGRGTAPDAHPSTDVLTSTTAGAPVDGEMRGGAGSVSGASAAASARGNVRVDTDMNTDMNTGVGVGVDVGGGGSVDACAWRCTCGCGERLNGLHPCADMASPRYAAPPHTAPPHTAPPPAAPPAYTAAPAPTPTPHSHAAPLHTASLHTTPVVSAGQAAFSLCPLTALPPALLLLCRVRWASVRGVIINVAGGGGFMGSERHWAAIAKIPVTISEENFRDLRVSAEGGVEVVSGGGGKTSDNGGKKPPVAAPSLASLSLATQTLCEALRAQQDTTHAPDVSGHAAGSSPSQAPLPAQPQAEPQAREKQAREKDASVVGSGVSAASSSSSTSAPAANATSVSSVPSASTDSASDKHASVSSASTATSTSASTSVSASARGGTVQLWVNLDSKLDAPRRVRCIASALWRLWQSQPDATVLLVTAEGAHGVIPGRE